MFCNELDLLLLRLEELAPVVDKFVLVEAARTHSGKPKDLIFAEHADAFRDYPIEDFVFDGIGTHWVYENAQRNYIGECAHRIARSPDDILIVSDADEIPPREAIPTLTGATTIFLQRLSFYYLNAIAGPDWAGSVAYRIGSENMPQALRVGHLTHSPNGFERVIHGGWHFAYCLTPEQIRWKIGAFAHSEHNSPAILAAVEQNVADLKYLYPGEVEITVEEVDDSYPHPVREHPERWRRLIR